MIRAAEIQDAIGDNHKMQPANLAHSTFKIAISILRRTVPDPVRNGCLPCLGATQREHKLSPDFSVITLRTNHQINADTKV